MATHSLMCRATNMWSMKICSFVPFFLKRPRRAACGEDKDQHYNHIFLSFVFLFFNSLKLQRACMGMR